MIGSKVLPFTIPKSETASITVQHDRELQFYKHLHQHPETQLSLIINGSGTLFCGNTLVPFTPYSLICVRGGQPHLFRCELIEGQILERISVFFLEDWLVNICEATPEISSLQKSFESESSGWHLSDIDLSITNQFEALSRAKSTVRFQQFIALLTAIGNQKIQTINKLGQPKDYRGEDSDRMSKIIEYTMNHYREPIYIAQVADKIALTPSSFCKYFKKRTGKSYVQFLNEIRCEAASNLLIQDLEMEMPAIAERCGYNSIANFNRQFKKYQGSSPSTYRKLKAIPTLNGVSY